MIIQQCFHQIIPCIGITDKSCTEDEDAAPETYLTELPFKRQISRFCHLAYPLGDNPTNQELQKLGLCGACELSKPVIKTETKAKENDSISYVDKKYDPEIEMDPLCTSPPKRTSKKRRPGPKEFDKAIGKTRRGIYECHKCGETIKSCSLFTSHLQTKHGILKSSFRCHSCPRRLISLSQYVFHVKKSHSEAQSVDCYFCCDSIPIEEFLLHSEECRKKRLGEEDSPVVDTTFQCHICGKIFYSNVTLSIHKRIHSGVKNFSCDECDYQSFTKVGLQRHSMIHLRKKDESNPNLYYFCKHCNKQFRCPQGKSSSFFMVIYLESRKFLDLCIKIDFSK